MCPAVPQPVQAVRGSVVVATWQLCCLGSLLVAAAERDVNPIL